MKILNKTTNTSPILIHANGNAHRESCTIWELLKRHIDLWEGVKSPLNSDLTIVTLKGGKYTVSTETILEKCCRKYGVPLMVLPWPEQRVPNFWEDSKAKQYEVIKAINEGRITTKYIMCLDCGDVVFIRHPNEILDSYLNNFPDKHSVWNGEQNDWPRFDLPKYTHHPLLDEYLVKVSKRDNQIKAEEKTPFAFLNSGVSIGLTDKLYDFYQLGMKNFATVKTNDQAMARISQYQMENHTIDRHCIIFQSLYNTKQSDFEVYIDD